RGPKRSIRIKPVFHSCSSHEYLIYLPYMKGFVEALEEIFGETCRVERCAPWVYRIEGGAGGLKLLFYRHGAEDRMVTTENSYMHIDEDHWATQPKKLLSRLKVRAGLGKKIHARDTVVARIDKKQAM